MANASGGDTRWENESSTAGILSPGEDDNSSVRSASDKFGTLNISNDPISSTNIDKNDKQGIGNDSIANSKTSTTKAVEMEKNYIGELTTLACDDSDAYKETISSCRENTACFGCESSHIVNICDDCLDNFCTICTKHHMKLNPKHILSALPCAGSGEVPKTMCIMHPDSIVELLCTQCSMFTCSSPECLDVHKDHDLITTDNIRPMELMWSKYFDNLLHAIHALQKRKHLAVEASGANQYSKVYAELERRELFIRDSIKTEAEKEMVLVLKRKDETVQSANSYLVKMDDSLKLAEKLRSSMAAAYHEGNAEVDIIVSAIQRFYELFPNIKQISECTPFTPTNDCKLLLETPDLDTAIKGVLECVKLQPQLLDNSWSVYSQVSDENGYNISTMEPTKFFFRHASFENIDISGICLFKKSPDSLFRKDYLYFSFSDCTLVSQELDDYFSNMVNVGGCAVINGTKGVHLLDNNYEICFTWRTDGSNHTFISFYSITEFIVLSTRQTESDVCVCRLSPGKCKMENVRSFDFDRRLIPQHHNQMFGISDGRVVLTEDGKHLTIVHLELEMIELHNLEKQLAGAVINCVYVDYRLNILIGCSDGKVNVFGKDKQLRLIYEMNRPVTSILGIGDKLYIAAFPNRLQFISFASNPDD